MLGRALAGRLAQAVIADKVAPDHFRPEQIRQAFADSCRRLQTDYLDVYFIHWPNIDLPITSATEALEQMRREGKLRAIGVSNSMAAEMDEARQSGRIDAGRGHADQPASSDATGDVAPPMPTTA